MTSNQCSISLDNLNPPIKHVNIMKVNKQHSYIPLMGFVALVVLLLAFLVSSVFALWNILKALCPPQFEPPTLFSIIFFYR